MSLVLAAIVITIFAAIFIPPYVFPAHDNFQRAVSLDSPFLGVTLHLTVNATNVAATGHILISGWVNSTSASIANISASDSWLQGPASLYRQPCTSGWPIGLGVMAGHYTQDNYTLGHLLPTAVPSPGCPSEAGSPSYFLLEPPPHSSKTLVDIGGSPQYWILQGNYTFGYVDWLGLPGGSGPNQLPHGVYTVVLADEWGDVLTTNFSVS